MPAPQIFTPDPVGVGPRFRIRPRVVPGATNEGQAPVGPPPESSLMEQIRAQGVQDLDAQGNASINAQTPPPPKVGLGHRILASLAEQPNVYNPESPDFAQAFLGTALGGLQAHVGAQRATEEEQYKRGVTSQELGFRGRTATATERQAGASETRANADLYRAQHPTPPGGLGLDDRTTLANLAHANRLSEILAQGEENRKTRRVPTATAAGADQGKVSQTDRIILDRYNAGSRAGRAAVAAAESQASNTYRSTGEHQAFDRNKVFSDAAHEANPSFASDSADAENRILPGMRPTLPDFGDVRSGKSTTPGHPIDTLRGFVRQQGGTTSTSSGPQGTPGPISSGAAGNGGTTGGENVTGLGNDEIEAALGLVSDIDDEQGARDELESAGYQKDEIDQIMSHR